MNELLMVVGAIFLLCAVIGASRGFIKIVASLLATLVIIVLVVFATPYVGDGLKKYTPLESVVQEKCIEMLHMEEVESASREAQIALIEASDFPEVFKDLLLENNNSEVYATLGVETFTEYVGTYFANLICNIVAFLVTFLLVSIIVRVALYILGVIGDLPVIGGINRLAGGAVGIVMGLLIVWVLFIVITLFYDWSVSKLFFENIAESPILQMLYDSNILMNFITKFRA